MSTSLPTRNTVFISYSHEDAEHLAKLRVQLAPVIRKGSIEVWDDNRIDPGDLWRVEIANAIQQAKAAILLVSDTFLASEYIADNELPPLLLKAQREGAKVLIVFLRDCMFEISGLDAFQWVNKPSEPLESMRHYNRARIWKKVVQLVSGALGNAERASDPAPDPLVPPEPARSQTLLVDGTAAASDAARGRYRTIADAIQSAEPGSEILIRPGRYEESLIIDKPLKITGMGTRGDTVIWTADGDVVQFKSEMGVISNLALDCKGSQGCAIQIASGHLTLSGCDITGKAAAAVTIGGGATPLLTGNRIHHSSVGVLIYESAKGWLQDNEIFANSQAGVEIKGESSPMLVGNRIHNNYQAGIVVREEGRGTLADNEIFGNVYSGAEIGPGGDPRLVGNRIHHGKAGGILIHDGGKGDFTYNDISHNTFAGVTVKTESDPTLRHNRICENELHGVYVAEDGRGTFDDNDIAQNGASGVEINSGGDPTLRRNRICDGKGGGVLVGAGGRGTLVDNRIEDNVHAGIAVTLNGDPTIRTNEVRRNEYGIYRGVGARGTYAADIDLQDNRKGATFDVLEEEATAPVESQASNH